MKRLVLLLFTLSTLYVIVNCSRTRQDLSEDITANEVEEIRIGMTLEQVERILGQPYEIHSLSGLHELNCPNPKPRLVQEIDSETDIRQIVNAKFSDTNYCCDGNRDDLAIKRVTLTYSKPVWLSKYYPMLWVHLDSNFQVYHVYAKRYEGGLGFDDPAIYSLHYTDKYVNSKLFYSTFKN